MLSFSFRGRSKPAALSDEEQRQNVMMTILASDFPGDEKIAEEIIPILYQVYCDDAEMAYMTFARGSILMQDAQFFTTDMTSGVLNDDALR
jgi:hypothetical protein